MLLSETGFSFGGVHSRDDMGLIYAEKDGHTAIPEIKRNAYSIAGMSGTLLLPGEAWQTFYFEGTLYPAEEPRTQAEAQKLLRKVTAWLTNGRQRLIFDYEPGVYYLAELSTASKWSLRNWFGGELPIRFTAQPFAYSVEETSRAWEITAAGTYGLKLTLDTAHPAPLRLKAENIGGSSLTGVSVGSDIIVKWLSIGTGETLIIDCEPPAGVTIDGENALPNTTAFTPVMLGNGENALTVALTFGTGNPKVRVTASARGRW